MQLPDIVEQQFRRIPKSEEEKRCATHGVFTAPHETGVAIPGAYRSARSWVTPPVTLFRSIRTPDGTIEHALPEGFVGTENLGLHPHLAREMQALRDYRLDPTNPADVQTFQRHTANVLHMWMPLVLAKIVADCKGRDALKDIEAGVALDDREHTLMQLYSDISPERTERSIIPTVTEDGARSKAYVHRDPLHKARAAYGRGFDGVMGLSFVAIHRGGMLPSLIGQQIAEDAGLESHIVGVDAKRTNHGSHFEPVKGAELTPPQGYHDGSLGELRQGFVFPPEVPEGVMAHIFLDPMLATGKSAGTAIRAYCASRGIDPSRVYVVSLFAGAYEGIERISDLGAQVITLAHDQADLTGNGYIQPGLGDAGDKLCGLGQDTQKILWHSLHLGREYAVHANAYAGQITGKPLRTSLPVSSGSRSLSSGSPKHL